LNDTTVRVVERLSFTFLYFSLITLRAKPSGAVYCYRSCLSLCVCSQRAGGRAVSVTTITRNCVHRSSPNLVCRCR